jgi:hypothetical protein
MKCKTLSCIAIAFLPTFALASARDDLAFETSEFMKRRVYHTPKQVSADVAPSGAYGAANSAWEKRGAGPWYIEEQSRGYLAIAAGVAQKDTEAIERGLRILEWGFRQQGRDGGFTCPDSFHSTSFFVEAAAHSCLLLQASSFAERYQSRIQAMKPRIAAAARWMVRPEVEGPGIRKNLPFTHRFYLVGAALGETGVLVGDPALVKRSMQYVQKAISLQDASGFNPEVNGHDTSYHALGLYYALVYFVLVADARMQEDMSPALNKGVAWLKSRIQADGSIDSTGNTRTGPGSKERMRNGQPKTLNYRHAFCVFAYFGQVTRDSSWEKLANQVAEASRRYFQSLSGKGT